MLLKLDDQFRCTSDKYNWILEKYEPVRDRKNKEIITGYEWKQIGWFGTNLAPAIKKYVNEKIKDSDTLEVKELLVKLDEIKAHIDKVVKKENIDFVYTGKKDDE
ncbi:hypothetical protein AF332_11965 [Sporosarcina globispora]|uniref:Uncharacterized protein n=1 Tax=Sporosarcina globispora TaxID=1459 RepID=A0A0M0GD84_SPOGL|nr:hypothetical protein [Sporosarcina globispora]KON87472.1 hypothetical protein AF332_11965 [Sporosarcina globispora]